MNLEKNQAIAYTTTAMRRLGYSKAEIEKVTNEMLNEFRAYSEEAVEDRADKILFEED